MKKFLLSALCAVATIFAANAADVTDAITSTQLNASGTSYVTTTNKTITSAATYCASTAKANDGSIQVKKSTVFLWNTAEAGTIKSISVEYQPETTARNLSIYASNTANTTTTPTPSGDATATLSGTATTWTPTENYKYFVLKNATNNAAYIAKITVVWTDGTATNPDPVVPELGEILLNNLPISGDVTVAPSEKLTFSCENATSIGYEVAEDTSDFGLVEASSIEWTAPATAGEYNLTISAFLGESTSKEAPVKVIVKAAEVVDPANSITDVIELKNFKTSAGTTPSGTSYTDATYTSANTGITYSGQMAAGNSVMQLRSTNSNSGIVVSANPNGYVAKSIKITWDSTTTSSRQLGIYGDNTAFANPAAIYATTANGNKAQGTEISKETYNANGASVTLTDNYTFLGFRSVSGAQYVAKIEIEWVPAAPAAPNAAIVHIFGSEGDEFGETIELKGQPIKVHFKAEEGVKVFHKFVAASAIATLTNEADYEGFNEYDGNGLELTEAGTLKHYTEKDGIKSAISEIAVSGSGTTSISEIVAEGAAESVVYDLQGRRVANASRGLYIVNGKKVIRK